MHLAMLWEPAENHAVRCRLCEHRCQLPEGGVGRCGLRVNVGGQLKTLCLDHVIEPACDPIEKKPLFHVLPGSVSLSIATPGCNFTCEFCQNMNLSQCRRIAPSRWPGRPIPPAHIVDMAVEMQCRSISYTYTEPTVFFELAYETARLARERRLMNCFVSNGFMTPEALETVAPYLDAINVDLKAFRDETYRRVLGGRLAPVLTTLRGLKDWNIWTEVTTLIVPDMNDSREELTDIAEFIANDLGPETPWHVTRWHDVSGMTRRVTPVESLEQAAEIGRRAGLRYIYAGNVHGLADESTYCPECGVTLIDRVGYDIRDNRLLGGRCRECGCAIPGRWD